MKDNTTPETTPEEFDDMLAAAKINSVEVQESAPRPPKTVMPLWQFRKLQRLGVELPEDTEVDIYDYKEPGGVVAYSNRAARRAVERERRRKGRS